MDREFSSVLTRSLSLQETASVDVNVTASSHLCNRISSVILLQCLLSVPVHLVSPLR